MPLDSNLLPRPFADTSAGNATPSRILVIIGTRPELIKLAPVIHAFRSRNDNSINVETVFTGQHNGLVDELADYLKIRPEYRLISERNGTDLANLTCKLLESAHDLFERTKPDLVVVQGDTTSAFAFALAAFYLKIDVAHVEAGLRTGDMRNPFPEEANRALIARLAAIHFAPTETARNSLIGEGIRCDRILVTGNTVIDAVKQVAAELEKRPWPVGHLDLDDRKRMVLVTMHRRESWDSGIANVCHALADVAAQELDVQFVFPVHPNKIVGSRVFEILGRVDGVVLVPALDYPLFVSLLKQCHFVVSDSGGVQEEAAALGKPVLVLRDKTERTEGMNLGIAKLVGTDRGKVSARISRLLHDHSAHQKMCIGGNPYGDGAAAQRITESLQVFLDNQAPSLPFDIEFAPNRPSRIAAESEQTE